MTRHILTAILLAACSAPAPIDAGDSHDQRAATKELCEYRHDCLGIDRDYPQCEADVVTCGVDRVLDCTGCVDGALCTCEHVASCLELWCGRGAGLGLAP